QVGIGVGTEIDGLDILDVDLRHPVDRRRESPADARANAAWSAASGGTAARSARASAGLSRRRSTG
ncbi:MAG TPA: hypothetical protein VM760_07810, partial [Sphingomicrobium sp.]|nr:hypothetical protein [Sphingomicrobium sp.]